MRKKNATYYCLILCGLLVTSLNAQIVHDHRFEIDYEWQYENHLVVSNEERGVTLIRTNRDNAGRTYPVKFTHLDKQLEEVWKDSIEVSSRMYLRGYHYLKDKLFVLFQDYPVRKQIDVVSIDFKTQKTTHHETSQIAQLNLTEFEVIQNTAVLGGYFEQRPVVFAYDLENDRVKAVQGVYKNNSKLLEVRINKDSVTFNVLVAELNDEKDQTIIVNTYDYEGNPVRDYTLNTKKDYSLIDGVSSSINDITQLVVGNYGYRSQTLPSGIFINFINRRGEQKMNYINYGDLPRFLDYLNPNRASKVKAKAAEFKEKGREQRYKLQSLARELVERGDDLILQIEYFKPAGNARAVSARSFRDFDRNFNNGYGIPDERSAQGINRTPISDYDFTHAYTVVLDKEGNLKWDDSFAMDYVLEGALDQHGRFQWIDDRKRVVFMYYDDKEVFAKTLDGTGETEVHSIKLEVGEDYNKRDEIESSIQMTRWYGDYFLAHGIQNVKSKDGSEPAKRVFFINAIRLERD